MSKDSATPGALPNDPSRMLTAFTAARLLFVPVLIATFMVRPGVTTGCLVLFMVADLYDGVLARRVQADGPQRRAVDSIVDRVAIDSCLVAAFLNGALPAILLCGFLARDLYCGFVCARLLRTRHVAIKADLMYRGLSVSFAAWAVSAPFLSASGRTTFAAAVFVASVGIAFDLARSARTVLNAPPDVTHRVIGADVLRKGAFGLSTSESWTPARDQERVIAPATAIA